MVGRPRRNQETLPAHEHQKKLNEENLSEKRAKKVITAWYELNGDKIIKKFLRQGKHPGDVKCYSVYVGRASKNKDLVEKLKKKGSFTKPEGRN